MTATTFLSELEALNMMLTAADEAPVHTADQPGHFPLSVAKAVLNDTNRVVQAMGWTFNTEHRYPLVRNTNGEILLPPNVLSVDVDDCWTDVDPVQRGTKLYDRRKHTYVFQRDLTATVIFLLPWEDLPQPARHYIAVRAARSFVARMQAGEGPFMMTEQDEQLALLALQSYEADTSDANFLTDSWSVASVLAGRGYPTLT